jgi:hypothetical protein
MAEREARTKEWLRADLGSTKLLLKLLDRAPNLCRAERERARCLRKALHRHGFYGVVETVWGYGYFISAADALALRQVLAL